MLDLLNVQTVSESGDISTVLYVMLLAFVLSVILAYVYQKTFRGLSYSRNYVQSIILISIVAAIVIQSVGDSLARGIGIMAAMAIIRFRTNLKDPRDTLFLFAGLAAGISSGAYAFNVAIIGTLGFSAVSLLLYYSPFGPDKFFDGMLRFNMRCNSDEGNKLEMILKEYCKSFSLVTLREIEQGQRLDYAYHIKLRSRKTHEQLMQEIKTLKEISGVNMMLQEATVDI